MKEGNPKDTKTTSHGSMSLTAQIRRAQGIFKDIAPDDSLAEELIQERRAEAQRASEQISH
jgi:hypothetical protein